MRGPPPPEPVDLARRAARLERLELYAIRTYFAMWLAGVLSGLILGSIWNKIFWGHW